jgi:hypothetical protein
MLLVSCKSSSNEGLPELEGKYAIYSGEEGWKISYPHNWLVKFPENNDVGFYAPKSTNEIDSGVGVRILELKKGTIEDLEKDIQKRTQTIERKRFFFRDVEAYDAIYEFLVLKSGKKIEMKALQRYVILKNKLFIITYAAEKTEFDKLKEIANKIMNSFEV